MTVADQTSLLSSRIICAGALIDDTRVLLANWNTSVPAAENMSRIQAENLLGKGSRSRLNAIFKFLRQRFLRDQELTNALAILEQGGMDGSSLRTILYVLTARADPLLHASVIEVLAPLRASGRQRVMPVDLLPDFRRWQKEHRCTETWNELTMIRTAQGLLSTLRDFGILQGAVNKTFSPFIVPSRAFAFIAATLRRDQPSASKLVAHPDWALLFFDHTAVDRSFISAHQERLLIYQAAGSLARIDFPTDSLEDYARALIR